MWNQGKILRKKDQCYVTAVLTATER